MPKNLKGDSRETPPTAVKELGEAVSPAGEASQVQWPWRRPPTAREMQGTLKAVPRCQHTGSGPGTCRRRCPGSWCRRPPSCGWPPSGSAAPVPSSSAPPDTAPGGTGGASGETGSQTELPALLLRPDLFFRQTSQWAALTSRVQKESS